MFALRVSMPPVARALMRAAFTLPGSLEGRQSWLQPPFKQLLEFLHFPPCLSAMQTRWGRRFRLPSPADASVSAANAVCASGLLLVAVFLALNWLGDSLDGTLARVRNRQRPRYGFYVDHVVDAFGTLFLLAGLALSGYMSKPVAAALLTAYYMLSIEVYLATYAIGVFQLSFWKLSPTELRILLAIGNIALLYCPMVH
jgi:phosphatidylglycerophosphate synthase